MFSTLVSSPAGKSPALGRGCADRGFTLIELLTVIGVIAILAAITLGVTRGVNERAAIGQARAELAVLSQALEAYKRQYGDYPQTGAAANVPNAASAADNDGPGILFNALVGKRGPLATLNAIDARNFIELSRFTLQSNVAAALPTSGDFTQRANAFVDPWGRRYLYYYKTGVASAWTQPGYVLLSVGPDGLAGITVANTGIVTESNAAQAADNLYANR